MAKIKHTGLKPNSHIELEIKSNGNGNLKFNTVVETNLHDEEFVVFAPMDQGKIFNLHTGQKLNVNFIKQLDMTHSMPCFFRTKVVRRDLHDGIAVVYLKKTSDIYKLQRRDFFRMSLTEVIPVVDEENEFTILTKDLSAGGLRGIVERKLRVNDEIQLNLQFVDEDFWIKGKVIRIDKVNDSIKDYDVRIIFDEIENKDQRQIIQFLFKKQGEYISRVLNHSDTAMIPIDTEKFNQLHDAYYKSRLLQFYRLILSSSYFLSLLGFGSLVSARPELRFGMIRFFELSTRYNWHSGRLYTSIVIFSIQLVLAIIGYAINVSKIDLLEHKISRMIIFSFFFSLICLIISTSLYIGTLAE
ncbi:MAG: flagellar brake protein [Firmicutes bacterium]|jgi:c-di-GMP-binding flagellar brake protein YcgR|nr:flagellar brake protein [Bacillota bacterium]